MFSAPSILLFDLFGDLAFGLGGVSGARGQLVQVPQLMPLTFCVTLLDVLVESVVEFFLDQLQCSGLARAKPCAQLQVELARLPSVVHLLLQCFTVSQLILGELANHPCCPPQLAQLQLELHP